MENNLLISDITARQLELFKRQPGHALIVVGATGSGKFSLVKSLAEDLLEINEFLEYPYSRHISAAEKQSSIGIEAVRELDHFLALKVPHSKPINRAIIIEDGHKLTHEAQNALLKILEEPPADTLIITTTNDVQSLLPTIRSRSQLVTLYRPSQEQIQQYFSQQGYQSTDIQRANVISGGLPGLMAAILEEAEHPLSQATESARQLLSQPVSVRLQTIDALAKEKTLIHDVAFIFQQMAHVSLQTAQGSAAIKWQNVLEASYKAAEQLKQNAQPKLVLTNLMLNI